MKIKAILKLIIGLLLVCLVVAGICIIIFVYLNNAPNEFTSEINISIKKGENLNGIALRLQNEKIIKSSLMLKLICIALQTETKMKAGSYHLPARATTFDVYNIIISGKENLIKITIPEGWTLLKIAKYLEEKNIVPVKEFILGTSSKDILEEYNIPGTTLEGYLFPDTYYFTEGLPVEKVIDKMLSNFFVQLKIIVPDYAKIDKKKFYEKIIMASIIEREYRVADEAVLIASVFYNRLKYNIGLESCATLEYIITDILGKPHPEYIVLKDKELDSLYNTYKWAGLPPGPISNPGKTAINAAFNPAKTDYYYFVLRDKDAGSHYFSKDLDEHINAKFYYLKGSGKAP